MNRVNVGWKRYAEPALVGFVVGLFVMTIVAYVVPAPEAPRGVESR